MFMWIMKPHKEAQQHSMLKFLYKKHKLRHSIVKMPLTF